MFPSYSSHRRSIQAEVVLFYWPGQPETSIPFNLPAYITIIRKLDYAIIHSIIALFVKLWIIIFQIQLHMKKENQYNVTDLSRALIREFLIQKGMKSTLQTYEKEDKCNNKKISKALLVDLLSIKNLCILNKQQLNPQSSLLQILVAYLNKKYQIKKNGFTKTEPQFAFQNMADISKKQFIAKQQTVELVPKQTKAKERPSTSKNRSKPAVDEVLKPAQTFEKEQLKILYKKVSKKQEAAVQKQVEVSKKEEKILQTKKQENIQHKRQSKTVTAIPNVNEVIVEEEYDEQFEVIQNQPKQILQRSNSLPSMLKEQKLLNNLPIIKGDLTSIPPSLHKIQGNLTSVALPKKQESGENKIQLVSQLQAPQRNKNNKGNEKKQVDSYVQNLIKQVYNKQTPLASKANKIEQIIQQKVVHQANLSHQISQQKINPLPIVHFSQPQPLELQSIKSKLQKAQNHNFQFKMGNSQTKQQKAPQVHQIDQPTIPKKSQQLKQSQNTFKQPQQSNQPLQAPLKTSVKAITQVKNQSLQKKIPEIKETSLSNPIQKPVTEAKQVPAPVMMTLGKKKKLKEQGNDANYPTKFKFDQNFTLEVPKQITYDYEPFSFEKIILQQNLKEKYPTLLFDSGINYKQKGGGVPPQKKKQQKLITAKQAQKLKLITFQQGPSILPKAWSQGFILSPFQSTPYGLKQIQGGPCGIIAAVQCYYLKHLLFCAKEINFQDAITRQVCLVAAITDVLWKVKSSDKIILAFPPKGASKIDVNNLRINMIDANDFPTAFAGVWANRQQYLGDKNFGVAALLFTAILTKGVDKIEQQIDIKTNPLIGNHGHCTQQFVNLLLTGKAISNCFDGDKLIDDYKIKGITERAEFGFLTIFETLKYIEVGKNLKNPVFPVWIICKEFHYHVIFGGHYLIAQNNKSLKFDIVYFDGLYNCGDRIRLTHEPMSAQQQEQIKMKDLPLIQQVMMTKWGHKKVNWNGSIKIL